MKYQGKNVQMMGGKRKNNWERVNFKSYQTPRSREMRTKNSSATATKRKNNLTSDVGIVGRDNSAPASSKTIFQQRENGNALGSDALKKLLNRLFGEIGPRWLQRKDMVLGAFTRRDFSDCARRGGRLFTTGRKEFYIFITSKTIFRERLVETAV